MDVFQAVADPTRRALLDRLRRGPASVSSLAEGFEMTRPAVSKHLRLLKDADLVRERKEGRFRYYELTPARLREVAEWAEGYRVFWSKNLLALKRHAEARHRKDER